MMQSVMKIRQLGFKMKPYTRSLGIDNGMPFYINLTTLFGKCVIFIIKMNQYEHGGKMSGHF